MLAEGAEAGSAPGLEASVGWRGASARRPGFCPTPLKKREWIWVVTFPFLPLFLCMGPNTLDFSSVFVPRPRHQAAAWFEGLDETEFVARWGLCFVNGCD